METSCGVVLVNFGSILLLQYPQGHWDFPKGHVEEGDVDRRATAARELQEETGISDAAFIEEFEYKTAYNFRHKGKRIDKQVFYHQQYRTQYER